MIILTDSRQPIATIQNQNRLSDDEFPIPESDVPLLQGVDAAEKTSPIKRRRNAPASPAKTPKRAKVQEVQTASSYGLRPQISPSRVATQTSLNAFETRAKVYSTMLPPTSIPQQGGPMPTSAIQSLQITPPTPTLQIQSSTPDLPADPVAGITNPPAQNVMSISESTDLDLDEDDSEIEVGKGKGKAGQPSNDIHNRIRSAFDTVNSLFSQLSLETSLSVDTIRSQYNKRTGAYSDWNAYGSYFAKNQEEELNWLPPGTSRDSEYC